MPDMQFIEASAPGGPPMIKALAAPFPDVRFVPTGGIDESSLADYLSLPAVLAVGGSWMVAKKLVSSHDFATVTSLSEKACAVAREVS